MPLHELSRNSELPAGERTLTSRSTSGEEDRLLVRGVLARDPRAVESFLERMACVPRFLSARNARLGGRLDAAELEDLAQETLLLVWRKLGEFRGYAALESWVYPFCYLSLMNRLRRVERLPERLAPERSASIAGPEPAPREFDRLYAGLAAVGPPDADVIRLKHFEELTFEEIGRRMRTSPNTAKTRYYRGLARLRRKLTGLASEVEA